MQPGDAVTSAPKHSRAKGFTLIELLVVLAIVSMLLSLAVPRYFQSIENAKSTVLVNNLIQLRAIIDKFFADTGRYPDSLDELVDKGYLKDLPVDPVADSSSTWVILAPKEGYRGRVYDIRSGATGVDRFGRPFSEL
jgi:general secretion pathway protein G